MIKNLSSQYIIAFFMLAFAAYQVTMQEYWEFALYFAAGMAFLIMGLQKNDVFPAHKKLMVILSWVFIITAGFMLLFLARTDF